MDLGTSTKKLKQQNYQIKRYIILHKFIYGFAFIYPNQIENLEKYGWLTLINLIKTTIFKIYLKYI
ncbi:hypothetical protein Glove_84g164 [Diversispora epigaea]|uniref:Uncharacterized protein n=1 Tax=Diversispora epigaea TaxID=1348612 RepID=A0A397JH21_9GLOM|nr:hypothetical protein Glove_84g164 [Diversispora epigaea]